MRKRKEELQVHAPIKYLQIILYVSFGSQH
jgi:hypothetical protein